MTSAKLYGLNKTNRDFSQKDAWGKNNFNSAFPASLCCYMASKGIDPVYLKTIESGKIVNSTLSTSKIFGIAPESDETYFAFEAQFNNKKITRLTRSSVWLFKMLRDYAENGKFNHRKIIDSITFNTKNDNAFIYDVR